MASLLLMPSLLPSGVTLSGYYLGWTERFAANPLAVTDDLMPWNQEMQRTFLSNSSDADH